MNDYECSECGSTDLRALAVAVDPSDGRQWSTLLCANGHVWVGVSEQAVL
jgi:hypothetical protein